MDYLLFSYINSLVGKSAVLDILGRFFAEYLIWLQISVFLFLICLSFFFHFLSRLLDNKFIIQLKQILPSIVRNKKEHYRLIVLAVLSSIISLGICFLISKLYFRARPFVIYKTVNQLLHNQIILRDTSFPSLHTTLAFTLAFSVCYYNKKIGAFFLISAFLIGFFRIFAGVHYPLDILAGIAVALAVTMIVKQVILRFQSV